MVNTAINLLPEQALEALHHDKLYKQKVYYLSAIGITLLILTVLGVFVYVMYAQTVKDREELLTRQSHRLEDLNPLWNDIIRLNQNRQLFLGVSENTEQIRTVLAVVLEGLGTLTMANFENDAQGKYSMELTAASKEESKRFVDYLRDALPDAKIQQIDTIRETDDEVFFVITLQFSAAK